MRLLLLKVRAHLILLILLLDSLHAADRRTGVGTLRSPRNNRSVVYKAYRQVEEDGQGFAHPLTEARKLERGAGASNQLRQRYP